MCGIAGIAGWQTTPEVVTAAVRRMCRTIVHRGPDDEGTYIDNLVGMGMRRLSIIDVAGGHQPIHNEDRTVWIVFNGEIYNFQELRRELEARGHRFYTGSDTEVIVHLYEDFGSACVQKLRGMFAFAIYDRRQQQLLLVRDRLGIKPLYYAFAGRRLLFGSEIKALLAAAPELKQIDQEGILYFFHFGYIPDPHTAFASIQKLPPGHLLLYRQGRIDVQRYWDLPAYDSSESFSEEECLEELEHRLAEAVRIRLISDVPLGALLSGGVDSSVVVALMAREMSSPVKTFSIGFKKEDFDESIHARTVAARFGTDHHELILEPEVVRTLDELTHSMEEPFGDPSILPTYYVSSLARQSVTVALSGDGGDELFAGYDRYSVNAGRLRFDGIPHWLGKFYRDWLYPKLPDRLWGRRFAYNVSLPSRDRYLDWISYLPVSARERALFSEDYLTWALRLPSPFCLYQDYFDTAPASDYLSRLLYLDTKTYLPADILTKVDRMSMATSLEVRVPLLDHRVVEWITRLPRHWKFKSGQRKYILRKLAERIGVPRQVLDRPKRGFTIPLVHWLHDGLEPDLLNILLEPRTIQRGYLNAKGVRSLLQEHLSGRRDRSGQIWLLLIFELWHRNFLEAGTGEQQSSGYAFRMTAMPKNASRPLSSVAPACT